MTSSSSGALGKSAWSALFKNNSSLDTSLSKCATDVVDGVAKVPQELIDRGVSEWQDYLVGYFIDKKLPFRMVRDVLTKSWKIKGSFNMTTDDEIFYFKFQQQDDKKTILEQGPVFIAGRLFVLKQWTQELEMNKHKLLTLPIWVKIWKLPKTLWNKAGLSYVASLLGEPLFSDEATCSRERLSFAKVCVEVAADFKFMSSLQLNMGSSIVTLEFEYPWKPAICNKCKRFGHKSPKCMNFVTSVWATKEPSFERGQTSCVRDARGTEISSEKEVSPIGIVVQQGNMAAIEKTAPPVDNTLQLVPFTNNPVQQSNKFSSLEDEEANEDIALEKPDEVVCHTNLIVQPLAVEEFVPCSVDVVEVQANLHAEPFTLVVDLTEPTLEEDMVPVIEGEVELYQQEKDVYQSDEEEGLSSQDEADDLEPEYFKDHVILPDKVLQPPLVAPSEDKGKKLAHKESKNKKGSPQMKPKGRPKGSCKKKRSPNKR
ncbi:zinc ion binding / nucleic acid binding protein [Thalictrum thalictroides]|uniref:Zinc ion binding / nucleic acid binding protein n=1 Tax=Thalictrum thalictroides TaxID=46969 RepID=A0A7J6WMB7_THATH|nr:zinc ion binding / nucleic acid binding protein [Thalictrum thalictroides]